MEAHILRQFLESLCINSQWSYAMFWKLQQLDTLKLLTCEDGYCDSEKSQHQPCPIILCQLYTRQEASISSGFVTNLSDAHSMGHPIGSAVVTMARCQYLLGEGMVGRVALGESYFWIYSDDIESTELISNFGYANEWLLPIAAGIKTTLLIPVLPFGVLQLGSFDKVAENQDATAEIRDLFFTLAGTTFNPSSIYDNTLYFHPSNVMSELKCIEDSSFACSILKQMEYEDMDINHDIQFIDNGVPTQQQLVTFMSGNCLELEDLSSLIDDQDKFDQYFGTDVESNAPNVFITNGISEATERLMFSCSEEEFYDIDEIFKDFYEEICTGLVPEQVEDPPADGVGQNNSRNLKGFSTDYDLQEALVPGFNISNDRDSWNSWKESECSDEGFSSLPMETYGPFDEDAYEEMVADLPEKPDDTSSDRCNNSKLHLSSLTDKFPTSEQLLYNTVSKYQTIVIKSLTSPPSLDSLESATNLDEEQEECTYELVHKKPKIDKLSTNEEKPKNNYRPRPRDRQLIQDRLKELRTLVPDTAKCSIDGLLDHTRKHMVFLKNVIEQADKVKQFNGQEAVSDNNGKNNGTSLPQGVGNRYEACPIIVKDLEHLNQFLIQMVCNEEGVFFEMAEVMQKLKLTILRGAIENRCYKWACFVVEASKGFNRLDIFWPLMRILQQNGNWMTDQSFPY